MDFIKYFQNDLIVIGIGVLLFYVAVLMMRVLRIYKKRNCPSCSGSLTRKKRTLGDRITIALTLKILPFKRYKCIHCGWEGIRWNPKKTSGEKG